MGFAHDANGRQIKATRASVPDAWTVYDALGNRVATKINDVRQYMVYDALGKLVAEYGVASEGLGGVKYIQQDWQGSVRTVTNTNGFVVARTDHQAFGGEVGYGTGQRSIDQGYNVGKVTRQGYGLTERDDATGLDHTWFRKNENSAGRWTSPDPYNGSMSLGDPQSFNRYGYVTNDPINFVDPSGLNEAAEGEACDYRGVDSRGFDIYLGTIKNGQCVANGGGSVQVYWTGGWVNLGGNNTAWVPSGGYPGDFVGGGGANSIGPATGPMSMPATPPDPCAAGTLQIGINGTGVLGRGAFTLGGGIAIDRSGNVGLYGEAGLGAGLGARGSVGLQFTGTNANSVHDLNGPFATGSIGLGKGLSGSGHFTGGFDRNNAPIVGGGFTAGGGAGASGSSVVTGTSVMPLFNVFGASGGENGCK
ncbi:MAG: RHS repeat-associated core domain-containing protein [Pyrinomonadaceae bacterium]